MRERYQVTNLNSHGPLLHSRFDNRFERTYKREGNKRKKRGNRCSSEVDIERIGTATGRERGMKGRAEVTFGNFGVCVISPITSVNRDRAAAGLQVYRTDNAARSIGFPEMQRRG